MDDVSRLRLFAAVAIPDEHLTWLKESTGGLRELWPHARWTPPENQHVSLKFLGTTPPDRLEPISQVMKMVASGRPRAEVSLGQLGSFPSSTRVRVLWAGLEDSGDLLAGLAGDLGSALEPLGYPVEEREFRPHLTLARFREPVRPADPLPELDTGSLPSVPVNSIELFRSHLSPRGARYEVVESFPLGASSPSRGRFEGE